MMMVTTMMIILLIAKVIMIIKHMIASNLPKLLKKIRVTTKIELLQKAALLGAARLLQK